MIWGVNMRFYYTSGAKTNPNSWCEILEGNYTNLKSFALVSLSDRGYKEEVFDFAKLYSMPLKQAYYVRGESGVGFSEGVYVVKKSMNCIMLKLIRVNMGELEVGYRVVSVELYNNGKLIVLGYDTGVVDFKKEC